MANSVFPDKSLSLRGTSDTRPLNPAIADTFYNGTLGQMEIYTPNGWAAMGAAAATVTIGTATNQGSSRAYNNGSADLTFSLPITVGGIGNSFTATSSPGSITGTSATSPITVTGLSSNTAYTFTIVATNAYGVSTASSASNSITATTIPQEPTLTSAEKSDTVAFINFTAGATGGSAITNYSYSTNGSTYTALSPAQTTSPLTISNLTNGNSYTFYIKAINANGSSNASSVSNSVTPSVSSVVTGGTLTSDSTYHYRTFTSSGTLAVSTSPLAISYAVVGAGGAGGGQYGGSYSGGGGGGGGSYDSNGGSGANGTVVVRYLKTAV